ncbi:hypothetical protein B0H13DRAFT_2495887 [Mycena leptocephala]|nr:hypothetical protein B0H13DRAFT_2495887 [Mycena leptocephala]
MHRGLFALQFVLLGLFILASGGVLETKKCREPSVKKEWWALSREQRKHWIASVKWLANSPNDHALIPCVNPPDITPYKYFGLIVRCPSLTSFARYIGLAYSFLGIAGIFTYLRRHYAVAVGIGELFRTGIGRKTNPLTDAAHFYESAFFKESDPKSGLGSWGEASTQFRVLDGRFSVSSSFWPSYPFPHRLRQKFNLFPQFEQVFPVPGLVYDQTRPANASFIQPVVESLIDGFKGFQARMEGVEVNVAHSSGPHINVHFIVGRWSTAFGSNGKRNTNSTNTPLTVVPFNNLKTQLNIQTGVLLDADMIGTTEGALCYVYD